MCKALSEAYKEGYSGLWEWGRDGTHCGAPGVGQVSVTVPGPDVAGGLTGQQVRLLVV